MGSIWETMSALENVSGELTKDINYSTSNNCKRIGLGTGMHLKLTFSRSAH